jgi:hypothetical protein
VIVFSYSDNDAVIIGAGNVGCPEDDPSYIIYDNETKMVEMIKV